METLSMVDDRGVRHQVLSCVGHFETACERPVHSWDVEHEDLPLTCLACIRRPAPLIQPGTPVKVTPGGVAPAQANEEPIGTVIGVVDAEQGVVDVQLSVGRVTLLIEKS